MNIRKFFTKQLNDTNMKAESPRLRRELCGRYFDLRVYSANGGKVVQVTGGDSENYGLKTAQKDQVPSLYIINDGDDLAQELSMILTREFLVK